MIAIKNNKAIFSGLVTCSLMNMLFIWTGVKTMCKHSGNPGNWHFIAALIGTVIFAFLLIVLFSGFYAALFGKVFKNGEGRWRGTKIEKHQFFQAS